MAIITKGDLVNGTLKLMRISGITVSPSPEEIEDAIQVADDYAAELEATGLGIGWNHPIDYGTSDPADNSGLSAGMAGPFKKLMLIELCSYFGKQVPMAVAATAASGMKALEQILVNVPDAQNPPTLPIGSGNEWGYRDRKFYNEPADNHDADYVYKGDILNYSHDFSQWLGDEALATVAWESDGILIASDSFTDNIATAQLTFNAAGGQFLTITATKTGSTDKITAKKNFIINNPTGLTFNA